MITAAIANPNGQIVGPTWTSTSSASRLGPPRFATIRDTTARKQKVAAATSSSVVPAGSWLVSP